MIADPRSNRATFVTSSEEGDAALWNVMGKAMPRLNIGLPQTYVILPSPRDELSGNQKWVYEPADNFRPSLSAVLDAVSRLYLR